MGSAGYSGTPLTKKLGIKEGDQVYLKNEPEHYFSLLSNLPKIEIIVAPQNETADFIHLFSKTKVAFEEQSLVLKPFLKKTGMFWVSWPKKSSKIRTDLSRDSIRAFLLNNGLVDVKVCAVDENWSGLKFVYRTKDRK